ncbi:MAG: MFS transporter, partial [Saprospiraceae bacterium]|nr:MFS transporter [Saprospiraceae bacterium]
MSRNYIKEVVKWLFAWPKEEQQYRQLAVRLGFLYLTELFAYQGYSLLINQANFKFLERKDGVVLSLHIGMLIGAIAWCVWLIAGQRKTYGSAFRISAWLCLVTSFLVWFLSALVAAGCNEISWQWFALARAIFGAAFSAGLGLTVVFIADQFPRYLRTRGATLACAIGFIGPLLAAISYWIFKAILPENNQWPSAINLGVGVILSSISLIGIIRQNKHQVFEHYLFDQSPANSIGSGFKRIVRFCFKEKTTTTVFWSCAFLGISISFFSDLLHLLPRMKVFKEEIAPQSIFFFRYLGIGLGTIWAGWLSWRKQSRRQVLTKWLWWQAVALFVLLLPPVLFQKDSFDAQVLKIYLSVAIMLSGFANASWIVNLLQTCEQFGRTYRVVAVLLAINVYRFGSIGLIFMNIVYTDWFDQIPGALFGLGLIYVGIGLVANRQLRNNFEGDGLDAQNDPDLRSLSGQTTRDNLLNIQPVHWKSEQESNFLKEVSRVMHERFDTELADNYYMSTLYFAHEHDARLGTSGAYHTREGSYPVRGIQHSDSHQFSEVGEELIETGVMASLAVWLEKEADIAGILIWFGGDGQCIDHTRLGSDWRTFNLSSINLPNNWEDFYNRIIRENHSLEDRQCALTELSKDAEFDETAWATFKGETEDPLADKLRLNLLFQCLEARGRYKPGLLFVYYVKPWATQQADLRGVLFLKMADQLSGVHLLELREILAWVLLQRAAALLQYSNRRIEREERHANWHELNTLVTRLENTGHWFRALEKSAGKSGFTDLKTPDFKANFQPALLTSRHLRNLNEYYAFLTKYTEGRDPDALALEHAPLIQPHNIDLKSELLREVENLKMNPAVFQFSEALPPEDRDEMIEKCLTRCRESIEQCFEHQQIDVIANPTGFRVVLHEIMKNAAAHAHHTAPRIGVSTTMEPDGAFVLHFQNNWSEQFDRDPARQQRFIEAIRHGIAHSSNNFGIRNVHRFIHAPHFSTAPWQFDCADPRASATKYTDVFLKIPA